MLTHSIDEIDATREREHTEEQWKRERRGKPRGRDWDDRRDAQASVLSHLANDVVVEVVLRGSSAALGRRAAHRRVSRQSLVLIASSPRTQRSSEA